MPVKLSELANLFGCKLEGNPNQVIDSISTLENAKENSLCFFLDSSNIDILSSTRAGCVILTESKKNSCPTSCLLVSDPYLTYAKVASYLYPPPKLDGGNHESASISGDARISSSAKLSENVVIRDNVVIGDNVFIGPNTVIGSNSCIANKSIISENVTIKNNVKIGERCYLHSGCVIGSDGFGFVIEGDEWIPVPQIGGVKIGSDVEIGANSTIDCGTIEDTIISKGVKIDNLVHIGHNVKIGQFTAIAGCGAIAGSTVIGKRCRLGGGASVLGHLDITDDVFINARSTVTKSIYNPGVYSGIIPAQSANIWKRNLVRLKNLDKLFKNYKS
ncbi:MAG: hypothetical protein CBC38_05655 [Gammaproteobacteria bacterium TMED78]|nr:MAG: hypothetical protein CBC38_05655 [Gammaproteobacteria bacterium TMED78]|tara:strand:- start:111134 stop:112129 length:996 start_codon:yes stop_codon:yes gene_type:complete